MLLIKSKLFVPVIILMITLFTFTAAVPVVSASNHQWQAEYFPNKTLTGPSLHNVENKEINFDWGDNPPYSDIPKDSFSVRWKRTVPFASAGNYRFSATTDDGMRVYLDDQLIIDSWTDSQVHTVTRDLYVTAGDHKMRVEYYEAGGKAVAKFNWVQLSAGTPTQGIPITNWRGEYFNNLTLSGQPVMVRDESKIDYNWGVGSPDSNLVTADNFSARWSRTINFSNGRYRFTTVADDGVRLWINNVLIIDQWRDQAATTTSVEVVLGGGNTPIVMEYYDRNGGAVAKLSWVQLTGQPSPPPSGSGIWFAEYFNNKKLSGTPLSTRNDAAVDFNWGYGSPVPNIVNVDNFSARWTATINFDPGRYRFTVSSDDGVRVYVNNNLIIDNWTDHALQRLSADVTLAGGAIPIRVEYYESDRLAEVHFSWAPVGTPNPGTPPVVVDPTGNSAVVTAGVLNVRSGPGVTNRAVTHVRRGQTVTIGPNRALVGPSTWVQVTTANGTKGWVNSRYLRTSVAINQLPLWNQ